MLIRSGEIRFGLEPPRARPWLRGLLDLLLLAALLTAAGLAFAQASDYRVGPTDVLKVTVWGHDDLSRTAVVSADGRLPFPLIGEVPVAGLTPTQIETRLRELLEKDYLVNPQVSVAVQEYRSQRVFVLGEAEKPGTYPIKGRTRLLDLLSDAGGPAKGAGRQLIVVRFPEADGPLPPGAAGSTTIRVSLKRLLDGEASENLPLQNGDTVYLPKMTGFFVLGEVKKPGVYPMEKDTTPLDAMTIAGGLTERAAPSGARILRKRTDGTQESVAVSLIGTDPKAREILLDDGDTLLVPQGNSFYVLGEVKKPGAYQLDQGGTAIEGIALAGGLTDKAAPNRTRIVRTHKDGRQETLVVDLNEILKRGRKDKDITLIANDVIIVPESFF
jgi:polysaccharide export outer membrane protein